jgi:hypothetical protein
MGMSSPAHDGCSRGIAAPIVFFPDTSMDKPR